MRRRSRVYGLYAVLVLLACGLRAQEASLSVLLQHDAALGGENITYTVTFANPGAPALNAVITDVIPDHTTFVSAQPAPGWTCGLADVGGHQAVRCTIPSFGPSSIFDRETMTIVLRIAPDFPYSSQLSNTVTIASDTPESITADNSATDLSDPEYYSDLVVTSTASPPVAPVGAIVTFEIMVENRGAADSFETSFRDVLPSFVSFVGIEAPGWNCTFPPLGSSGEVLCERARFLPGTSTIRIFGRANGVGEGENVATVIGGSVDLTPEDRTATVSFGVVAPAQVPTLSSIGLILLGTALLAAGIALLRKSGVRSA
jgi:uncharacterized repeat protein (TIGR01451 family)